MLMVLAFRSCLLCECRSPVKYIYMFPFFSQEVSFELISTVLCLQGTVSAAFVHEPAAVWVDTEEKSCPGMEIAM